MYIYIHIYIFIYFHKYLNLYTYIYIYQGITKPLTPLIALRHVRSSLSECTYILYKFIYIYIYIYICILYLNMYVYIYIYIYIYLYIFIYIYIYVYTYINMRILTQILYTNIFIKASPRPELSGGSTPANGGIKSNHIDTSNLEESFETFSSELSIPSPPGVAVRRRYVHT
jgi:hypothetical protein